MIYSFLDIAIQIFVQIPISNDTNKVMGWFGFHKIWLISPSTDFVSFSHHSNELFALNT